jgi:hypothetical protein
MNSQISLIIRAKRKIRGLSSQASQILSHGDSLQMLPGCGSRILSWLRMNDGGNWLIIGGTFQYPGRSELRHYHHPADAWEG